jgi:hypothetical protein
LLLADDDPEGRGGPSDAERGRLESISGGDHRCPSTRSKVARDEIGRRLLELMAELGD